MTKLPFKIPHNQTGTVVMFANPGTGRPNPGVSVSGKLKSPNARIDDYAGCLSYFRINADHLKETPKTPDLNIPYATGRQRRINPCGNVMNDTPVLFRENPQTKLVLKEPVELGLPYRSLNGPGQVAKKPVQLKQMTDFNALRRQVISTMGTKYQQRKWEGLGVEVYAYFMHCADGVAYLVDNLSGDKYKEQVTFTGLANLSVQSATPNVNGQGA